MMDVRHGIILVGHGGIPKDYPKELVTRLKRLESERQATGSPITQEEMELDRKIRSWPRTPETDPYQAGLEKLASYMRPLLDGAGFAIAYNEFCGPTLPEAVEELIAQGVKRITIVSTMFTPGGSHSEFEIPEALEQLRKQYPAISFTYAWPFDLAQVARMLMEHIRQFE